MVLMKQLNEKTIVSQGKVIIAQSVSIKGGNIERGDSLRIKRSWILTKVGDRL